MLMRLLLAESSFANCFDESLLVWPVFDIVGNYDYMILRIFDGGEKCELFFGSIFYYCD